MKMIFIGWNSNIGLPRYHDHHFMFTDSRCLPRFMRIWWNNLKDGHPLWQILEWLIRYRNPYCEKCIEKFIECETFSYYHGIKNPTRHDRIDIVNKLIKRFK